MSFVAKAEAFKSIQWHGGKVEKKEAEVCGVEMLPHHSDHDGSIESFYLFEHCSRSKTCQHIVHEFARNYRWQTAISLGSILPWGTRSETTCIATLVCSVFLKS